VSSVLIIEDDSEVQTCLCEYLVAAKHDFICATNGSDGVQLAALHRPDAIVMDIRLPDADGVDVAQRLRYLPSLATVPILFLTGNVDSHVVQAARWMRHTSLLRKPCNQSAFVDSLNESLGENRTSRRDSDVAPASVEQSHCDRSMVPLPETGSIDRWTDHTPLVSALASLSESAISEHWPEYARPEDAEGDAIQPKPIALEDVVDDVSHDARSTLFVLTEFARQTAQGLEGQEHADRLRMLRVVEDRLVELTMLFDILHVGRRITAGYASHLPDRVSLSAFLSPIIADCEHLCRRKSCMLSCPGIADDLFVELSSIEIRTTIMGLFSHILSIAESGSTIRVEVEGVNGSEGDNAEVHVMVEGLTAANRAELTAAAVASDRAFDPCSFDCNPKLAFAASVAQLLGGGINVAWTQRQYRAAISFPVRASIELYDKPR